MGIKRGKIEKNLRGLLLSYYESLFGAFGPQGWWPGDTRFEVIVGAILTQNTSWSNVEKAVRALKSEGLLKPGRMHSTGVKEIARLIRPAGYFNIKAQRLKNFTGYLFKNHSGSLGRLFNTSDNGLREELLGVNGIGPETADSILLYAGRVPEFVVDAYTKRIFSRHSLISGKADYGEVKALFMENLPADESLFNEYHALLVKTGKDFCKTRNPLCGDCPLGGFL